MLALLGGLVGYGLAAQQSQVRVVSGKVWSSGYQAQASIGGWVYDVPFDVEWQTVRGSRAGHLPVSSHTATTKSASATCQ
ncbi:MAG TPA: hypothetical protein VGP46_02850 [Acidimicrobiales bacterium]|nr:hypothetical protein [Acidimicrobiales bacterium]